MSVQTSRFSLDHASIDPAGRDDFDESPEVIPVPLEAGLSAGRQYLAEAQKLFGTGRPASDDPPLDVAVQAMNDRGNRMVPLQNGWARDGQILFPLESENRRLKRTYDIVQRTAPGPLEDGLALERLAREAAAVELCVEQAAPTDLLQDIRSGHARIILGTTARPTSHAGTLKVGGVAVISLSSGMLHLIDALTTGSMSAMPAPHAHERGFYGTRLTDSDIHDKLDQRPEVVALVVDFFSSWLRAGQTPEASQTLVPPEIRDFVRLMRAHAERFVVGHEYCHALVDKLNLKPWWADATADDPYAAEIRADLFATRAVARTSEDFDRVPANVGLQGAILAMKAHELLDSALAAINTTRVAPSADHLPFDIRARMCVEAYRWFLQDPSDGTQRADGMLLLSRLADLIWERAFPQVEALGQSADLHPIWRGTL